MILYIQAIERDRLYNLCIQKEFMYLVGSRLGDLVEI